MSGDEPSGAGQEDALGVFVGSQGVAYGREGALGGVGVDGAEEGPGDTDAGEELDGVLGIAAEPQGYLDAGCGDVPVAGIGEYLGDVVGVGERERPGFIGGAEVGEGDVGKGGAGKGP